MGISNSIGSNTFDILLCLGVPWLIKSAMLASAPPTGEPARTREEFERAVVINSDGLEYSALSLLSATLLLFVTFGCYQFRLNKRVGFVCLALYAVFLTFASLVELNVFFEVNLPICESNNK
jgi:Ca2+/Na+ antiporter